MARKKLIFATITKKLIWFCFIRTASRWKKIILCFSKRAAPVPNQSNPTSCNWIQSTGRKRCSKTQKQRDLRLPHSPATAFSVLTVCCLIEKPTKSIQMHRWNQDCLRNMNHPQLKNQILIFQRQVTLQSINRLFRKLKQLHRIALC